MTDSQSKHDVIRVGSDSISRYSNAIIKRAIDDIAFNSPQIVRNAAIKKKILVAGWEIGEALAAMLPSEGYDVKLVVYHGGPLPSDEIYSELSQSKYDLVIISLWNLWEELLEIRKRFPQVKTIFLNSYKHEWSVIAKQRGVNAVFPLPFDYEELLTTIEELLLV